MCEDLSADWGVEIAVIRAFHVCHECDWKMWPECCCRCAVPPTKKLVAKLEAAKLGPPSSNCEQGVSHI